MIFLSRVFADIYVFVFCFVLFCMIQFRMKSLSLSEICSPFDSVYVSFYKGLGGISGAMLVSLCSMVFVTREKSCSKMPNQSPL